MRIKLYIAITLVLTVFVYLFSYGFMKVMNKFKHIYDYELVAQKHIENGHIEKALDIYRKKINYNTREIKRYKAYKERRETFEAALRYNCKKAIPLLINYKHHSEAFNYAIEMYPDSEAFRYAGDVRLSEGNFAEAAQLYKISIFEDFTNYYSIMNKYKNLFEETKSEEYRRLSAILNYHALLATNNPKYAFFTKRRLDQIIEQNPDDILSKKYYALLLYEQNKHEDAAKHFKALLKKNPSDFTSAHYLNLIEPETVNLNKIKIPLFSKKQLNTFRKNPAKSINIKSAESLSGILLAKSTKVLDRGSIIKINLGGQSVYRQINSSDFMPYEFSFNTNEKKENSLSINFINDLFLRNSPIKEDRNFYVGDIFLLSETDLTDKEVN